MPFENRSTRGEEGFGRMRSEFTAREVTYASIRRRSHGTRWTSWLESSRTSWSPSTAWSPGLTGPDNGLGIGGEALHTWAFSDASDDRRLLRGNRPLGRRGPRPRGFSTRSTGRRLE